MRMRRKNLPILSHRRVIETVLMYHQEGGKYIFQTEMGDKEDFVLIGAGLPRTGTMSTR
jgi:hypothetical protein